MLPQILILISTLTLWMPALVQSGDGLCVGRDSGDAVSDDFKSPREVKGGTIQAVGVNVEKAQYLDLEKITAAAFAVD